jgi:amidase
MSASRGPAMSWDEWARHDATALAGLVKAGKVTPRELASQAAAAVQRLDGKLQAVLGLYDDVLANPDKDGPSRDGLLYGVPIFLKDLGSGLAGRTQESGSALCRNAVARVTDPTVENYLAAGLVPIGRSTTPEFGMTFDTVTNYLNGVRVTRNPWNLQRTAGGSSGGSAAAVAAGITPVSMSSDGGGSTRIPASFCGLVGLKATRGRVPQPLARNEYMTRISIDGVVTRSVRDTAAVYEKLTRIPNGGSFIAMGPPKGSYVAAIARDPGRLRIGLSTGMWGRKTPVDPQVAARVREVAKLLEGLGHTVEELDDAKICDWDVMWPTYVTQWMSSRSQVFPGLARERGIDPKDLKDWLNPMTWRHFVASQRYDQNDLWKMMAGNNTVTRSFGRLMERYDVLLTPTLAIRVPAANGPYSLLRDDIDVDAWVDTLADACRYTMPGNETGMPGISVPAGLDADGVPIGVQVHGNFAAEDVLLQVAAQIERARPQWFGATPGVHVTTG